MENDNKRVRYVTKEEFDELEKSVTLTLDYILTLVKRVNILSGCVASLQSVAISQLNDKYGKLAKERELLERSVKDIDGQKDGKAGED